MFNNFDDLDLVKYSVSLAEDTLLEDGNIIQPIITYSKNGHVDGLQCDLPEEVLKAGDIRERVVDTVKKLLLKMAPDEIVIIREGFFEGDVSKTRFLSLIYSIPSRERTWVTPIFGREIGSWREIKVLSGDLYNLFEKTFAPWN